MEDGRYEETVEKWTQSTDQAMPEAHTTTGVCSYMSNESSLFVKPISVELFPI